MEITGKYIKALKFIKSKSNSDEFVDIEYIFGSNKPLKDNGELYIKIQELHKLEFIDIKGGFVHSPIIINSSEDQQKKSITKYYPLKARLTIKGWSELNKIKKINWPFWICFIALMSLILNLYTCNRNENERPVETTIVNPINPIINLDPNPQPKFDISEVKFSLVSNNYSQDCQYSSNWRFLPESSKRLETIKRKKEEQRDLKVELPIANVGGALAKDVNLSWNLNYTDLLKALNSGANDTIAKLDQNFLTISECGITSLLFTDNNYKKKIDRILPITSGVKESIIEVPDFFVRSTILYNRIFMDLKKCPYKIKNSCYYPEMQLTVNYKDPKDSVRIEKFDIFLRMGNAEFDPEDERGLINLELIENSR